MESFFVYQIHKFVFVVFLILVWRTNSGHGLAIPDDRPDDPETKNNTEVLKEDSDPTQVEVSESTSESVRTKLALAADDEKLRSLSSTNRGFELSGLQGQSEDDQKVRKDWGGTCSALDWKICSKQTTFGQDKFDETTGKQIAFQMDCSNQDEFPPLCLYNSWTVTRCHLFCMSTRCNKGLKKHYDNYVQHDGYC